MQADHKMRCVDALTLGGLCATLQRNVMIEVDPACVRLILMFKGCCCCLMHASTSVDLMLYTMMRLLELILCTRSC